MQVNHPELVSVHGGHSGQFCQHASDTLESVIEAYIRKGFVWIGITEHMPPLNNRFLYPDEIAAGLNADVLRERFSEYIATCRRLQHQYRSQIDIYVGFETETYTGSEDWTRTLIATYQPDYIVGSLHHVDDIGFDVSIQGYEEIAGVLGGVDALYGRYFDLQYDMIAALRPAVIGHFDLIRLFDPDYPDRLKRPAIQRRVERNLELIRSLDLILDINMRAFTKGGKEPYPCRSILHQAGKMGIAMAPGDDSHGIASVGSGMDEGLALINALNLDNRWRRPVR